jgi:acyl-CoA thioester hydrolase
MPTELPSRAIQNTKHISYEGWFEYSLRVQPHHTDYAGVVWHGTYIAWLEEARVECLRSHGINYEDLVALGCDLPVVDLSIRYQRPLSLGNQAIVKSRMLPIDGIRITWEQAVIAQHDHGLCIAAQVVNVGVDREKGKILRRLPPDLKNALTKIYDITP